MAQTKEELLTRVPLFQGLSKRHLRHVANLTTRIDTPAGQVLTREGEFGLEFFVILEGEVEIRRGDELIAKRGSGDFIGEIALIEHRPRTATIVTTTPATLEVIDARAFSTLLTDEPEIAEQIRAIAAERVAELEASDDC